ncbi:MAG: YceI family protein [Pseudomonadota bacterium]
MHMSRHLKPLLLVFALIVPLSGFAAPMAYALETQRSNVGFIFTLNKAQAKGVMPVKSADISIDLASLQRSSVDVTVDVTLAKTGFFFATEALKGASVLNAKQFKTIRFVSTRVRLNGAGRLSDGAKIDGNLTIRGVTRPVTLNAALFRQAGSAAGDLSKLGFKLTGRISRAAFGAAGYKDIVDDTVLIDILARVTKR